MFQAVKSVGCFLRSSIVSSKPRSTLYFQSFILYSLPNLKNIGVLSRRYLNRPSRVGSSHSSFQKVAKVVFCREKDVQDYFHEQSRFLLSMCYEIVEEVLLSGSLI